MKKKITIFEFCESLHITRMSVNIITKIIRQKICVSARIKINLMSINSDTKVINRLCIVKGAFVYKYIKIHPNVELNKNVWISKMLKKRIRSIFVIITYSSKKPDADIHVGIHGLWEYT